MLATADDHQDSDGAKILTFYEAQDAARRWSEQRSKGAGKLTVEQLRHWHEAIATTTSGCLSPRANRASRVTFR